MPKKIAGIWLPDAENYLIRYLPNEPVVAGAATFQLRKYRGALKFIRKRRTALDIGAHCGIWSRVMARDFTRLEAFEPLPLNHECFDLNLRQANGCAVTLHKCALGTTDGTVKMQTAPEGTCFSYLSPEGNIEVPLARLDSFDLGDEIDFVKIDCEGAEAWVLEGGEATIRRNKPFIIVEQKKGNGPRLGLDWKAAVTLLKAWGAIEVFNLGDDHGMMWRE